MSADRNQGHMGQVHGADVRVLASRPAGAKIRHFRRSALRAALLDGHCHRRRARHHPTRDLRCDQECRNHGGHAYQSEKLIHRKHLPHSPKVISDGQVQSALCAVCRSLVRTWSVTAAPEIVSSARIEMTANVFIERRSVSYTHLTLPTIYSV